MVHVVDAEVQSKPVLWNLVQLYAFEFSEFTDQDVDEDGTYAYKEFDRYWTDPDRHPYLLRHNGHHAGFAFVHSGEPHDMAEFFIMKKYRRGGLGMDAAHQLFALHPGAWQVREMAGNVRAVEFWRRAIPVPYVDKLTDRGPVQTFYIAVESQPQRSRPPAEKRVAMDVRRVVTGHDGDGNAVFVSDQTVAPITLALVPGNEFHRIWGADQTCTFPNNGIAPDAHRYFPPVGGFRFGFFTIPPDGGAGAPPDLDFAAALAEFEEKLPGMAEHLEPDAPGMHTTATVDCGVVLSGQVTLELDNGAKVTMDVGDTYVQNGTRHRWSNSGTVPAVLAVSLVGAVNAKCD